MCSFLYIESLTPLMSRKYTYLYNIYYIDKKEERKEGQKFISGGCVTLIYRGINMHENPFMKVRKQRIQQIKEMIREHQPVKHNKLVAMIAIEFGATEKTSLSMLRALQDAEFIEYSGLEKKVWTIKESEK